MKLYVTSTSPYVRKVLVTARELGLSERIEPITLRPSPLKADAALSRTNPLNKIPVLVLDDGTSLYDSPVICEYLQTLVPSRTLLPESGMPRFRVLRTQALCDGILEAAVSIFYETVHRPEAQRSPEWMAGQREKALQGLDELESETFANPPDLGGICAAVTVGWLLFRSPLGEFLAERPRLAAWYREISERPSLRDTAPHL